MAGDNAFGKRSKKSAAKSSQNAFPVADTPNGFAEQRLRAFVDNVVAPAEQQRRAADRAAMMDWAGSTWPAVAAKAALSGAMLPGDVAQGKFSMDDPRAIERLTDLTGLITLGAGALPAQKNTLRAGIKAYHGSPHDFDEFSLSKIGTGEGAQAYGHGLYFADSEDVARSYRDTLSDRTGQVLLDGSPVGRGMRASVIQDVQGLRNNGVEDSRIIQILKKKSEGTPNLKPVYDEVVEILEARPSAIDNGTTGRMYEVEIDANPDDFLDYDADLLSQSAGAQAALEKLGYKAAPKEMAEYDDALLDALLASPTIGDSAKLPKRPPNPTGSDILTRVGEDRLKEVGIPGIKYLDGSSRAAGEGSRNYVVFDDKLINILRKYGIAIPAGMAGYEMTQDQFRQYVGEQQAQQYERENNASRLGLL